MRTRHRYDEEEDALIIQVADNYPQNLSEGFRELSDKLGLTPTAISSRYYVLKKKELEKSSYSFVVVSKKKVVKDRKVVRQGCPIKLEKNKVSLWRKILKLLGISQEYQLDILMQTVVKLWPIVSSVEGKMSTELCGTGEERVSYCIVQNTFPIGSGPEQVI